MPETRSMVKRRRVTEGPLFGGGGGLVVVVDDDDDRQSIPHLPTESVGRILVFLDLESRIRLSMCNSAWRRQVFDVHSELWHVIDFGGGGNSLNNNNGGGRGRPGSTCTSLTITDPQLEALLRKSHARERCRILKLNRCTELTGLGLEPLRGSSTLRELDLRLYPQSVSPPRFSGTTRFGNFQFQFGPVEIDIDFVLPLLSSMAPMATTIGQLGAGGGALISITTTTTNTNNNNSIGLTMVKFRMQHDERNFYSCYDERVSSWFRELFLSLNQKAIEQRTKCGYCNEVIMSKRSDDLPFEALMASCYCEKCNLFSCGRQSCPIVLECNGCSLQCCQPANECRCLVEADPKFIVFCGKEGCSKMYCEDCSGEEGYFCSICHEFYCCFDCGFPNMDFCRGCEDFQCHRCITTRRAHCQDNDLFDDDYGIYGDY